MFIIKEQLDTHQCLKSYVISCFLVADPLYFPCLYDFSTNLVDFRYLFYAFARLLFLELFLFNNRVFELLLYFCSR